VEREELGDVAMARLRLLVVVRPFLDLAVLADLPIMKEAAEFFLDYLVEDPQGRLVTGPSGSKFFFAKSRVSDPGF